MPETTPLTKERLIGGLIAAGVGIVLVAVLIIISVMWQTPKPEAEVFTTEPTVESEETAPAPTLPANPYGPMDFDMSGEYATCLAGVSVLGIDVSAYQKDIDWEQVRQAGIEFVMIRLGYRGSEQGLLLEDSQAQLHYAGAKAAGLRVGAYFFSQSISEEEAREEARYAMALMRDWELDMPLVYDWEYISADSRTGDMDARRLTNCIRAFCETAEAAGVEAMVYFNPYMARNMVYLEELTDYPFWLAHYNSEMTFPYKVDMWQYTCTGNVPGIQGDVDINLYLLYE